MPGQSGTPDQYPAVLSLALSSTSQDVPDVLGDRANHIRSLSVRIGPAKALRIASWHCLAMDDMDISDEPTFVAAVCERSHHIISDNTIDVISDIILDHFYMISDV